MLGTREQRMAELESSYPVWERKSIWGRFLRCAQSNARKEFLVTPDCRMTYGDVCDKALCVAAGLESLGVREGSAVIVHMRNRVEFIIAALALARLGAVKVLANSSAAESEIELIVEKTGAIALVTDARLSLGTAAHCPLERAVIVAGGAVSGLPETLWDALFDEGRIGDLDSADAGSVSDIMFTSGSTGMPKCVPLTHDQLQRSAFSNALNRGFEQGRIILPLVPFCHCFGYVEAFLSALFVGGTLVFSDGRLTPEAFVDVALREHVNDVLAMPYTMAAIADYLDSAPASFPELHAAYCAGERTGQALYERVGRLLGICDIVNGYGMTEICGAAMQSVPGDSAATVSSRVGRIMPAGSAGASEYGGRLVEYRVMRDDGTQAALGEVGSIEVRGLTLTSGYMHAPEANERDFIEGGWFKTGDVGRFDPDGYLELMGREKEAYRINGENVSPAFVESIIEGFGGIVRAMVLGVPDERFGQVGCVFVQFDRVSGEDFSAIRSFCDTRLASFQIPKYFIAMDEGDWPRTESGKVRRKALLDAFESGEFVDRCVVQSFKRKAR